MTRITSGHCMNTFTDKPILDYIERNVWLGGMRGYVTGWHAHVITDVLCYQCRLGQKLAFGYVIEKPEDLVKLYRETFTLEGTSFAKVGDMPSPSEWLYANGFNPQIETSEALGAVKTVFDKPDGTTAVHLQSAVEEFALVLPSIFQEGI